MKFTSFYCDDIRHETDGRRSFMGVYPTTTVVPKFPHIFSKICLFVEIELRHSDGFLNAEIVIVDEDHEMARLPISDKNLIPIGKGRYLGFEVTMSPIVVDKPETMHAKLEIGGESHPLRHLRFVAKGGGVASDDAKVGGSVPARKIAKKSPVSRKRST